MLDNSLGYHLQADKEFVENMSADFLIETVTFPNPIPDRFGNVLYKNFPDFKKERHHFLANNMHIVKEMYKRRFLRGKILESGDINFYIYELIEFLKDYPQYKKAISHVEIAKPGLENASKEVMSLNDFIDNVYYNPYLNEKKHLVEI